MHHLLSMQLLLGVAMQSPKQEPLPTFNALLEKIKSSRIQKMPYYLTIREVDFHSARPPSKSALRNIWWDADHQRVDRYPTLTEYPVGSGVPARMVQGINIEKPGYGIEYDEEANLIARFKPIQNFENKFNLIVNPINFGHSFGGIWRDEKIDQLVSVFFAPPLEVSLLDSKHGQLLKVSKIDKRGYSSEILVDPNKDYEIVSIQFKGDKVRESISSLIKNWDGHWYPEQIIYEQWYEDNLTTKKEIQVQKASFKKPIPYEIFTLAGIKMLPRHAIRVDDKLRLMRVDDGKLVPFEEKVATNEPIPPPATMPVRVPEEGEWRFNPWTLTTGVLLGVLAMIIVILIFRSRRTNS